MEPGQAWALGGLFVFILTVVLALIARRLLGPLAQRRRELEQLLEQFDA